ncbi:hypothetical protein ZIOFF_030061 [Zingiber officinale]|uniref:Purple acid phosphatase Fn3-like domain-containing protein n=1 Tax=Zingiber officinale TaxID=94328 RepID=A0A8J5GSJ8_ZINOF|nr:hypothetical protein ZIOFF_030061 [Zingiber officinale]
MSFTSASSLLFLLLLVLLPFVAGGRQHDLAGVQPLSRVAIHRTRLSLEDQAFVRASPPLLGLKVLAFSPFPPGFQFRLKVGSFDLPQGEDTEWVIVELGSPNPTPDDWIGVFSPANFNASTCSVENPEDQVPLICTSPIKVTF